MLTLAEGEASQSSIVYYRVPDVDHSFVTLTARGVPFPGPPHLIARMPDHDLWMAILTDSEGNTLGLMEERRSV